MSAKLLTTEQTVKFTGLSTTTINRLRRDGDFVVPIRMRGTIRYRLDELEQWLADRPRVNEKQSRARTTGEPHTEPVTT